jgi:hypothetical protein
MLPNEERPAAWADAYPSDPTGDDGVPGGTEVWSAAARRTPLDPPDAGTVTDELHTGHLAVLPACAAATANVLLQWGQANSILSVMPCDS